MQCINKIALITGAASGYGLATAKLLSSKGFKVACCDRNFIHKSPDSAIVNEINGNGNTIFCGMDCLSTNDISSVLDAVKSAFGEAPHVVVNAEHTLRGEDVISKMLTPHSLDLFQDVIERNVVGFFNVVRLASREMLNNERTCDGERGIIVNTSGISAVNGSGSHVAFSAAMAAIAGMTLPLARGLGRHGIRCVCIQPGLFDVPELKDYEDTINVLSQMTPFPRRLGTPDEYARLVECIIWNPMLNGCSIRLDGGIRS